MTTTDREFLTSTQLGLTLGLLPSQVRHGIESGLIPFTRANRMYLIATADLAAVRQRLAEAGVLPAGNVSVPVPLEIAAVPTLS